MLQEAPRSVQAATHDAAGQLGLVWQLRRELAASASAAGGRGPASDLASQWECAAAGAPWPMTLRAFPASFTGFQTRAAAFRFGPRGLGWGNESSAGASFSCGRRAGRLSPQSPTDTSPRLDLGSAPGAHLPPSARGGWMPARPCSAPRPISWEPGCIGARAGAWDGGEWRHVVAVSGDGAEMGAAASASGTPGWGTSHLVRSGVVQGKSER